MINYNKTADAFLTVDKKKIAVFHSEDQDNIDEKTVDSFGEEWSKFADFDEEEIKKIGDEYFDIVPDSTFGKDKTALDVGCGSGRWTLYIADKFGSIESIDPSDAVKVASKATEKYDHIRISKAGVDQIPFEDNSFDFVFSLGVLHHIPDTSEALKKAVAKLKPGGSFLLYLYYSLDNRGFLYKTLFRFSNIFRWTISKMPTAIKKLVCDLIALLVYAPFVGLAYLLKSFGISIWKKIPLSYYVGKSYFVIRNDALDRFGTPLEQRFSKLQIEEMMESAGLTDVQFSNHPPYWHAIGKKA